MLTVSEIKSINRKIATVYPFYAEPTEPEQPIEQSVQQVDLFIHILVKNTV